MNKMPQNFVEGSFPKKKTKVATTTKKQKKIKGNKQRLIGLSSHLIHLI